MAPSLLVLLVGTGIFVVFALVGYFIGWLSAQAAFSKRLKQAKARYSQHPEHMTDCPIYKEFVITDILLQMTKDELDAVKARAAA